LRLLAVLNAGSSTPALVKRRAPPADGPLTHFPLHFTGPGDEKSGLEGDRIAAVIRAVLADSMPPGGRKSVLLSAYARFFGIFQLFFRVAMLGWWGDAGFGWGCAAVRLDCGRGSGGGVLSGFARIVGFWDLDGCGRFEGLDGVSPLAPVHGLADGLGGWLRWLRLQASFFVVLLLQIQNNLKK